MPHHGLDLVDPDEPFSVADFAGHVASVLPAIAASGGLAILVGGTGFYLRAVARGIDLAALPFDREVRRGIEADLAELGLPALSRARLVAIAPTLARASTCAIRGASSRALEIATLQGDRATAGAARLRRARVAGSGWSSPTRPIARGSRRGPGPSSMPGSSRRRGRSASGTTRPCRPSAPSATPSRGRSWTARSTGRPRSRATPRGTSSSRSASGRGSGESRRSSGGTHPRRIRCPRRSRSRSGSSIADAALHEARGPGRPRAARRLAGAPAAPRADGGGREPRAGRDGSGRGPGPGVVVRGAVVRVAHRRRPGRGRRGRHRRSAAGPVLGHARHAPPVGRGRLPARRRRPWPARDMASPRVVPVLRRHRSRDGSPDRGDRRDPRRWPASDPGPSRCRDRRAPRPEAGREPRVQLGHVPEAGGDARPPVPGPWARGPT